MIANKKIYHLSNTTDHTKGFTLIEILIAMIISAILFVLVSSLLANLFRSDTKSKQSQTMEQTKNDIRSELTNAVRWADNLTHDSEQLFLDEDIYRLEDNRFVKNSIPLSHRDIEVSNLRIVKHTPRIDASRTEAGFGLTGAYYNNQNFTDRILERVDDQVNFDWGNESPDPTVSPNTFSARWTGQIESVFEGEYAFRIDSNDGARVWIDDELVLDAWDGGSRTGSKYLLSNKRYNILIEYYEVSGGANIGFSWALPGGDLEIVPSKYLYPNSLSVSLEITMELVHKRNSSLKNTLKTVLTPRSGVVASGLIDNFVTPTPTSMPASTPTPSLVPTSPPTACVPWVENVNSGWPECNGWATNPNYNKQACRTRALRRARATYSNNKTFYQMGLPLPPSGNINSAEGGTDQQWYNWGAWSAWTVPVSQVPSGHFLGVGTSCGIGPNVCKGELCPM